MKIIKKFWYLIFLPVLIILIADWLTPIDIPGNTWKAFLWFINLFLIKVYLPIWGIILLMLAIPFLFISFYLLFHNNKSFENYRSDTFFEVLWEWDYDFGEIYKEGIKARCPHCKTILKIDENRTYNIVTITKCTHCGFHKKFTFGSHELRDRVIKEIDRKITTGEYKKIVQQAD